jgi:hypothetical protein
MELLTDDKYDDFSISSCWNYGILIKYNTPWDVVGYTKKSIQKIDMIDKTGRVTNVFSNNISHSIKPKKDIIRICPWISGNIVYRTEPEIKNPLIWDSFVENTTIYFKNIDTGLEYSRKFTWLNTLWDWSFWTSDDGTIFSIQWPGREENVFFDCNFEKHKMPESYCCLHPAMSEGMIVLTKKDTQWKTLYNEWKYIWKLWSKDKPIWPYMNVLRFTEGKCLVMDMNQIRKVIDSNCKDLFIIWQKNILTDPAQSLIFKDWYIYINWILYNSTGETIELKDFKWINRLKCSIKSVKDWVIHMQYNNWAGLWMVSQLFNLQWDNISDWLCFTENMSSIKWVRLEKAWDYTLKVGWLLDSKDMFSSWLHIFKDSQFVGDIINRWNWLFETVVDDILNKYYVKRQLDRNVKFNSIQDFLEVAIPMKDLWNDDVEISWKKFKKSILKKLH